LAPAPSRRIVGHIEAGNADRPAARVISIRLFSTTSGGSTTLPSVPCAFASKPTQSIALSDFRNAEDVGNELAQAIVPG